jgi:hypothetical protein
MYKSLIICIRLIAALPGDLLFTDISISLCSENYIAVCGWHEFGAVRIRKFIASQLTGKFILAYSVILVHFIRKVHDNGHEIVTYLITFS